MACEGPHDEAISLANQLQASGVSESTQHSGNSENEVTQATDARDKSDDELFGGRNWMHV